MEEDERRKIDLRQHTLSPVSKKYLLRIILYVVLLTGLSLVVLYLYNREVEKPAVKNPEEIQEIRGIKLSD